MKEKTTILAGCEPAPFLTGIYAEALITSLSWQCILFLFSSCCYRSFLWKSNLCYLHISRTYSFVFAIPLIQIFPLEFLYEFIFFCCESSDVYVLILQNSRYLFNKKMSFRFSQPFPIAILSSSTSCLVLWSGCNFCEFSKSDLFRSFTPKHLLIYQYFAIYNTH